MREYLTSKHKVFYALIGAIATLGTIVTGLAMERISNKNESSYYIVTKDDDNNEPPTCFFINPDRTERPGTEKELERMLKQK